MKTFIFALVVASFCGGCRPADSDPKTSAEMIREQGGRGIDESNRTTNAGAAPGGANSRVKPNQ